MQASPARIRCVLLALLPLLAACDAERPLTAPAGPTLLPTALAVGWTVSEQDLGTLGGSASFATGISNAGTVVGWAANAAGDMRAFRWTVSTGMQDLGTLPGHTSSRAVAIAGDGRILGLSWAPAVTPVPVFWTGDPGPIALPIPIPDGATFNEPSAVNSAGQVVGFNDYSSNHGWLWSRTRGWLDITATIPGGFESYPSAINTAGVVAGSNNDCSTACTYRAFTWTQRGGYRDLGLAPGATNYPVSAALGLNDRGVVTGWHGMDGDGDLYAFVWTEAARFRLLPRLAAPYPYAYATAVNAGGTAVGGSLNGTYDRIQAVAWPAGGGIVPLFPALDVSGVATDVADNGWVTGWRETSAGTHAMLWRLRETPGASSRMPPVASVRAGTPPADEPACLRDPRALRSRSTLAACATP